MTEQTKYLNELISDIDKLMDDLVEDSHRSDVASDALAKFATNSNLDDETKVQIINLFSAIKADNMSTRQYTLASIIKLLKINKKIIVEDKLLEKDLENIHAVIDKKWDVKRIAKVGGLVLGFFIILWGLNVIDAEATKNSLNLLGDLVKTIFRFGG